MDNKEKRPCIVLATEEETSKVICVPLTSQIDSFNKYNYKYCLIPMVIYDYRKMSFASLENLMIRDYADIHDTGIRVDEQVVDRIINKISDISYLYDKETFERLMVNREIIKQEEKKKARERKQLRKIMRKNMKQFKSE